MWSRPAGAAEGIVLRYGTFYGPGASDLLLETVRNRTAWRRRAPGQPMLLKRPLSGECP
jgi:hypothetical protein